MTEGLDARFMGGIYRPVVAIKPEFGNWKHINLARTPARSLGHAWVEFGGTIIDITLTQFDPSAAPVSAFSAPDIRYAGKAEPLDLVLNSLPFCGFADDDAEALIWSSINRLKTARQVIAADSRSEGGK